MSELLALADRCERSVGLDRELGFEVLLACGWRKTCVGHFHGPLYQWSNGSLSYSEDRLPCPTRSIDTAMTLGDPAAEISISTLYGVARVEYPLNYADAPPCHGEHVGGLIAPAICAAILRAYADLAIRRATASANMTR